MKKLKNSIIYAMIMTIVIGLLGGLSLNVDAAAVPTPTRVKNFADFESKIEQGSITDVYSDTVSGDNWEKSFDFEVKEEGYVLISVRAKTTSATKYAGYALTLFSKNLTKNYYSATSANKWITNSSGRVYLTPGIYTAFLSQYSSYKYEQEISVHLGYADKNSIILDVKYVENVSESGQTVKLKLNSLDEISTVYVDCVNYGSMDSYTQIKTCGSLCDVTNNEIIISMDKQNYCYVNIAVKDVYGQTAWTYRQILNDYTATVTGIKNKNYTGNQVKQSDVTVKAGYHAASYTTKYENNINVGTATVQFYGKGYTIGSVKRTFKILGVKLTKPKLLSYKSGTKSIAGITAKNVTVNVKVGSKTYTTKSNENGYFKVTINALKVGEKIKVVAVNGTEKASCSATVKNRAIAKPKISSCKKNTKKITGTAKKNTTVTVKIGKKTYKSKVNSNGKFTVKVSKLKKGNKLYVKVVDNYGNYSSTVSKKIK